MYFIVLVVQSLSCIQLFATPWTAAHQPSLSFTISWSLLKLMSIESVMPSNHLILCRLLLLRIAMTNLYIVLKCRDITLLKKGHIVKAMVFPLIMYGCESWTKKKAEHRRIDTFKLRCWRSLLTVPWTARKSNQSMLKEMNSECFIILCMTPLKKRNIDPRSFRYVIYCIWHHRNTIQESSE